MSFPFLRIVSAHSEPTMRRVSPRFLAVFLFFLQRGRLVIFFCNWTLQHIYMDYSN